MDQLNGKVAVVTGAASGIGRALAERFVAEGMKVALADVEQGPLDEAVSELGGKGEVIGVPTDVRDPAAVDALRDAAVEAFQTVHVVCNNAGVSSGARSWEGELEAWRWVMDVNFYGVLHGVRAFAPLLVEQGEGHIVNTASMAGLIAGPFMGAYNASKFATVALTETLYNELALEGSAVGVSVLCPGWVDTKIADADRNMPAEVASAGFAEADGADAQAFKDFVKSLLASGLTPATVADEVVRAIHEKRLYILTHREWASMIRTRMEAIVEERNPAPAMLPT
jgi:NAD(P)-dependent dehydrogenase (short-subunit alcohol dehydrogenase family)